MNQESIDSRSSVLKAVDTQEVCTFFTEKVSDQYLSEGRERFDSFFQGLDSQTGNLSTQQGLESYQEGSFRLDETTQSSEESKKGLVDEKKKVVEDASGNQVAGEHGKMDSGKPIGNETSGTSEKPEAGADGVSENTKDEGAGEKVVSDGKTSMVLAEAKVSSALTVKLQQGAVKTLKASGKETQSGTVNGNAVKAEAGESLKGALKADANAKVATQSVELGAEAKLKAEPLSNVDSKLNVQEASKTENQGKTVEANSASKANLKVDADLVNNKNTRSNKLETYADLVKVKKSEGSDSSDVSGKKSAKVKSQSIASIATDGGEEKKVAGKQVQKVSSDSAKSTRMSVQQVEARNAEMLKNELNVGSGADTSRIKAGQDEIGIKDAEQAVIKTMKVASDSKTNDTAAPEKGFLKESNENGAINRALSVKGRSDVGGFFQESSSGNSSSDGNSQSRNEQFRQWVEGNSEVRGNAQAAQGGQLLDKGVSAQLSARVVNQIMNHIEKLRESDKNRIKVSLGSESSGVTVDIRIEGDVVHTSFEGNESIINDLKEKWEDIKDRASDKGVELSEPEYISSSSSSESESFFPDVDIDINREEKSQSVIQHDDNQPVRPGFMTAAAGSSGPVHSYA